MRNNGLIYSKVSVNSLPPVGAGLSSSIPVREYRPVENVCRVRDVFRMECILRMDNHSTGRCIPDGMPNSKLDSRGLGCPKDGVASFLWGERINGRTGEIPFNDTLNANNYTLKKPPHCFAVPLQRREISASLYSFRKEELIRAITSLKQRNILIINCPLSIIN
jgi:hypothetical protein